MSPLLLHAACLVAVLAGLPHASEGQDFDHLPVSVFPSRYQIHQCSLKGSTENKVFKGCQFRSLFPAVGDQEEIIQLRFGERNCTIVLEHCSKNVCYSFRDLTTNRVKQDPIPHSTPSSIFTDVRIISGAKDPTFNKYGFAFKPTGSQVVLQYSTAYCAEYYAYRGGEVEQCDAPVQAATILTAGLPTGIDCGGG